MVLTTSGKTEYADDLTGRTLYLAIGTGTGAFTEDSTGLNTELLRVPLRSSSNNGNRLNYEFAIGPGLANGQTITEIGVFTNNTGGNARILVNLGSLSFMKEEGQEYQIDVNLVIN